MRFNLTEEDFLKGKIIDPGWYQCEITGYEEKMSTAQPNKPSSAYVELKMKILGGPNAGVVLYQNFSEKAPGFIIPFVEALRGGQKMDPKKPEPIDFSKDKLVGQFVDVEVVRGSYNNKPTNQVNGFKPFSGTKPAAVKA